MPRSANQKARPSLTSGLVVAEERDDRARERELLRERDELLRVRLLDGRVRVAPRGEDEAIRRRLPTVSGVTPLLARCVAPPWCSHPLWGSHRFGEPTRL